MAVPRCFKCDGRHYSFYSCEEARQEQNPKQPPVEWSKETLSEWRPFGDRFDGDYYKRGDCLYLKEKRGT